MSNNILPYRVWNKVEKRYIDSIDERLGLDPSGEILHFVGSIEPINTLDSKYNIERSTGRRDIDGEFGFENDNVSVIDPILDQKFTGIIIWEKNSARFVIESEDGIKIGFEYIEEFEILGAIHD